MDQDTFIDRFFVSQIKHHEFIIGRLTIANRSVKKDCGYWAIMLDTQTIDFWKLIFQKFFQKSFHDKIYFT